MGDDNEPPRNRKERRAAAKQSGKPISPPTTQPKVKMVTPDYDTRPAKGTTLLDLYESKKALLDQGQPFDPKYEDGKARDESGNVLDFLGGGLGDDEPIGPVGQAIFWTFTLGMLHFTLDVLVFHQYRQEIEWPEIFTRSGTMLPIIFLFYYLLHSKTAKRFEMARQLFFLAVAAGAGCYVIRATNMDGYYLVMKETPPLGTLWVWSVIEMDLSFSAVSVLVNLGYLWYKGYTVF